MYRNRSDFSPRWWVTGSSVDSVGCAYASSTTEESSLRPPIPILLKDGVQPNFEATPQEWLEAGASPEDGGRTFELGSKTRRLILYQPRKTETNSVRSIDLAVYFPFRASIRDIRLNEESLSAYTAVPQGAPVVLVGRENAFAVRMRATHPDLRRNPIRFDESGEYLRLLLHLADFGRDRDLKDEDLIRYSAFVTLEEKKLNNPRALEGFEHDLVRQEVWDDFSGQPLRRVGFIGDGFKLTGTVNQIEGDWVDRFVVGV